MQKVVYSHLMNLVQELTFSPKAEYDQITANYMKKNNISGKMEILIRRAVLEIKKNTFSKEKHDSGPLNINKIGKIMKKNRKTINRKKMAYLCHLCTREDFMRGLFCELDFHDFLLEMIVATNDISMKQSCLYAIGELTLNIKNIDDFVSQHWDKKIKKYISSKNKGIKFLAMRIYFGIVFGREKLTDESSHLEFINCVKMIIDNLIDEEVSFSRAIYDGKGWDFLKTTHSFAMNSFRFLLPISGSPSLMMRLFYNGIKFPLEKIKEMKKSKDTFVSLHATQVLNNLEKKGQLEEPIQRYYENFFEVGTSVRETTMRKCSVCMKEEKKGELLKKCARCKKVLYCGRDCQVRDWKTHKLVCKKQK